MDNTPEKFDKNALQAEWVNTRMASNPNWRVSMPAARPIIIHDRKSLVVWRMTESGPQIIDMLQVVDSRVSFTSGISLQLVSGTFEREFVVSAHPREVLPGVFMWVPPFAEVRFAPMKFDIPDSSWRMTVPVLVRTAGGMYPKPGEVTVSSVKEFRAQWPGFAL